MANFEAGLTDQDELGQFPSAVSPLHSMGIDPDMVRANPELLAQLSRGFTPDQADATAAAMSKPKESPSTAAAGQFGGAGAPTPTSDETPEQQAKEGLGLLNRNLQSATEAANQVPTKQPEEITRLVAQKEKLATPAPLYDTATGKPLDKTQEYDPKTGQLIDVNPKASTARKIWRGVRGGLLGFAGGGIPGAIVGAIAPQRTTGGEGYNAPSTAYQRAEQRREEELGATDTSLQGATQRWKEAVDAAKAKAGEFRSNASLGKDLTTGATGLINAENKENKPEISQQEFDQRVKQADRLGLKGPQRNLFIANGKLPDPTRPTEGELTAQQVARATSIWKASHGGKEPQTLEDFNQIQSAARGQLDKGAGKKSPEQIEQQKNAAIEKANSTFATADMTDPASALAQYQKQLQTIQDGYENDLAASGYPTTHQLVGVDSKGQVTWTPQAAPVPAPTQPTSKGGAGEAATAGMAAPDGTVIVGPKGEQHTKINGKWDPPL